MSGTSSQNPAGYVGILSILVEVAEQHGYALGLHGSLARDMDLIAVPWTKHAVSNEELIAALDTAVAWMRETFHGPSLEPHGRRSWSIGIGTGAYIDISVMPRVAP